MSIEPVIAFGQQPCGFFPRRFLVAKIRTARRLQAKIGGRVVYFCHDSDHDPRETRTILRHRATNELAHLNFAVVNKLQRKFSPLYAKRITTEWHARTLGQLPNYVDRPVIELYDNVFIPALRLAETDRHRGTLDKVREEFMMESMGEFIAELAESEEKPVCPLPTEWRILCLPAKDRADELAAAMLAQLLELSGIHAVVLPSGALPAEILETKSAPASAARISAR